MKKSKATIIGLLILMLFGWFTAGGMAFKYFALKVAVVNTLVETQTVVDDVTKKYSECNAILNMTALDMCRMCNTMSYDSKKEGGK